MVSCTHILFLSKMLYILVFWPAVFLLIVNEHSSSPTVSDSGLITSQRKGEERKVEAEDKKEARPQQRSFQKHLFTADITLQPAATPHPQSLTLLDNTSLPTQNQPPSRTQTYGSSQSTRTRHLWLNWPVVLQPIAHFTKMIIFQTSQETDWIWPCCCDDELPTVLQIVYFYSYQYWLWPLHMCKPNHVTNVCSFFVFHFQNTFLKVLYIFLLILF